MSNRLAMSVFSLVSALAVAGCFTVCESDYPRTEMTAPSPAATNVAVEVRGFEAVVTDYVTVYGQSTVVTTGSALDYRLYGPRIETVTTSSQVPRQVVTEQFLRRAKDRLETAGFLLGRATPDYVVEVSFSGPSDGERSAGVRALLWVLTAFTYDRTDVVWSARLKIRDNRTGRLVLAQDYSQRYDVAVWSPIPLFGPLADDRTDDSYMQAWCLGALTDRATADASAFLAGRRE